MRSDGIWSIDVLAIGVIIHRVHTIAAKPEATADSAGMLTLVIPRGNGCVCRGLDGMVEDGSGRKECE